VEPGVKEFVFRFPTTFNPNPPQPQRIPLLTTWYTDAPKAQIEIRDVRGIADPINITLEPDESAYIYNHDKPKPSEKEMIGDRIPCTPGAPLEDHDFKWLYQLLEPPKGNWDDWRGPHRLPAPLTQCPAAPATPIGAEPKAPTVSTCFGGRWGD